MKTIKLLLALIILLKVGTSYGQQTEPEKEKYNQFYVGLNGGTMISFSNIKTTDFFPTSKELSFGGGAVFGYQITPFWSVQAQFIAGQTKGVKEKWLNGGAANLISNTNSMEFDINTTVSILKIVAPHIKANEYIDLYGLVGIGNINFNSKLKSSITDATIESVNKTNAIVFPVGVGVKFKINENWNVGIESNLRSMITDKFDAFMRNTNPNDKYSYTHIGVQYIFGKNKKSLNWVNMMDYKNRNNPIITKQETPLAIMKSDNDIQPKVNQDSLINAKVALINERLENLENKEEKEVVVYTQAETRENENSSNTLLPSIYFDFNKTTLDEKNDKELALIAVYLQNNPDVRIKLVSHTDNIGSINVNKKISQQRVDGVYNKLVNDYKIDAARLEKESKYNTKMLSKSKNYLNRRVDFIIIN